MRNAIAAVLCMATLTLSLVARAQVPPPPPPPTLATASPAQDPENRVVRFDIGLLAGASAFGHKAYGMGLLDIGADFSPTQHLVLRVGGNVGLMVDKASRSFMFSPEMMIGYRSYADKIRLLVGAGYFSVRDGNGRTAINAPIGVFRFDATLWSWIKFTIMCSGGPAWDAAGTLKSVVNGTGGLSGVF